MCCTPRGAGPVRCNFIVRLARGRQRCLNANALGFFNQFGQHLSIGDLVGYIAALKNFQADRSQGPGGATRPIRGETDGPHSSWGTA